MDEFVKGLLVGSVTVFIIMIVTQWKYHFVLKSDKKLKRFFDKHSYK